jgi:hypothetical protein
MKAANQINGASITDQRSTPAAGVLSPANARSA